METVGDLIDKLVIINIRIWMLEDVKRDSQDDHEIADATRKTNVLNQQRNDIKQEIDLLINSNKPMKIYGAIKKYGKNKSS